MVVSPERRAEMKKWAQYQLRAQDTACFPSICVEDGDGLYSEVEYVYPLMGLMGEIGEVAALASIVGAGSEDGLKYGVRYELKHELGDVLWYLAELATTIGLDLSDAANSQLLAETDKPVNGSVIWLRGWLYGLMCRAADISEILKKAVRDHDGRLSEDRQKLVVLRINDTLEKLQRVAGVFGWSLDEVAEANLAKLASRKERGVIQGEGSDR